MINTFKITSNLYLNQSVTGFYHTDFYGYSHPQNPNFLYKLKNDPHHNWDDRTLYGAQNDLKKAIYADFPEILRQVSLPGLVVCTVPRSKAENTYRPNQLLFKTVIGECAQNMPGFHNGVDYIKRHTSTFTTHMRKTKDGYLNDGCKPYPGISVDTCYFSQHIQGRDILLVDDIYTKTVNIDEDMLQALLNNGARSVVFYAIGKTVKKF